MAVVDVNLDIKFGEFVCLLGFFGCGKFMLLNLVVGFVKFSEGSVIFDNKVVIKLGLDCGMVF